MRVQGPSMRPTLAHGDHVLVDPDRPPAVGALVAARPAPLDGVAVVKRVSSLAEDGSAMLSSDNPDEGTDSRRWGAVPADRLDGVVTVHLDRWRLLLPADEPPGAGSGRHLLR